MSRKIASAACVAALLALMTGCGGGSSTAGNTAGGGLTEGTGGTQSSSGSTGSSGGSTQTIQGIATPSSVSVVTANNAN